MNFYTISDVAGILGTSLSSLRHHIYKGHLPRPSFVVRRRPYYLEAEVQKIRQWWSERVPVGCSRFNAEDVAEMRKLWESGVRQAEIAERYNTTQTTISELLSGDILPGWRGGRTGRGRERPVRQTRRRNVG